MYRLSSVQLMLIGLALLMIGVLLPFLMVSHVVESTLWLNFLAYFASLFGLIIGLYGVVQMGIARRKDQDETRD
jgi:hypothetical protein